MRDILDWQLEQYDFVQRASADRLVNFYCLKDSNFTGWPKSMYFPMLDVENPPVASVYLVDLAGGNKRLRADMNISLGRFFGIEFRNCPAEFFDSADLSGVNSKVVDVKVWVDLMHTTSQVVEYVSADGLIGWVREMAEKGVLQNALKPLAEAERLACIERIGCQLPVDYLEFVGQTAGALIPSGEIYGLSSARRVALPGGSYFALAEVNGKGMVGVGEDGSCYVIDNSGGLEFIGSSFRQALQALMGN
jgi:hypothetical protein